MKVLVACWVSFLVLNDSPNHVAKWPLAEASAGTFPEAA
jgi:hypothetical protein